MADIVPKDPGSLTVGAVVPLVPAFRHAGRVTVDAAVTPPGTPDAPGDVQGMPGVR